MRFFSRRRFPSARPGALKEPPGSRCAGAGRLCRGIRRARRAPRARGRRPRRSACRQVAARRRGRPSRPSAPSGRQERLNCWAKNLTAKMSRSQRRIVSRAYTPVKGAAAPRRSIFAGGKSPAHEVVEDRSRAARRARRAPRSSGRSPRRRAGSSSGLHRGVEDVAPARLRRTGSPAAVRLVCHELPHQRLGHRSVDAVHRHVVAVVGRPAERQLGEVPRADDQPARGGWRCPSAPGCARAPARFHRSRRAGPWS